MLTGTFQITDWQENTEHSFEDGSKQTKAVVTQQYSGDISGLAELTYLMHYYKHGSAYFTGLERINATFGGKETVLTLSHQGKFEQGIASSEFTILDATEENALVGKKGVFRSAEGGQANYEIGAE